MGMSRFVQSCQINANEEQTGAKKLSEKKKLEISKDLERNPWHQEDLEKSKWGCGVCRKFGFNWQRETLHNMGDLGDIHAPATHVERERERGERESFIFLFWVSLLFRFFFDIYNKNDRKE